MTSSRSTWSLLPVILCIIIAISLWLALSHDPKFIPSVMIGKSSPEFNLPPIEKLGTPGLSKADFQKGKVSVVNIWASWCVPCREEQPLLMALSQSRDIQLVGIDNKDASADARGFLGTYGNPFSAVGSDFNGRTTIDWGTYGVPETFIVDGKGIIRFKVIGGLGPSIADGSFFKELTKASQPPS